MKIVHLTATLRSGGAERQLVETLKFFKKTDDITCEVVVMSDVIHYDYIEDMNIKIHQIIRKANKDLSIFLKFYHLFRESKPDLIHSWHSMCSMYAIPAAKLLGIKLVNNSLRNAPKYQNEKDLKWHITRMTFPFSDVIAANSYAGLDAYNVPRKKKHVFTMGLIFQEQRMLLKKKRSESYLIFIQNTWWVW
ncbi:MAG: glycosyltransferase [Desulfamplus sp.]|nr:glycosyltransferase [Desulfamplus sp.]